MPRNPVFFAGFYKPVYPGINDFFIRMADFKGHGTDAVFPVMGFQNTLNPLDLAQAQVNGQGGPVSRQFVKIFGIRDRGSA